MRPECYLLELLSSSTSSAQTDDLRGLTMNVIHFKKSLSDAKSEKIISVKPQYLEGGDITGLIAPVLVRLF